jgi:DNA-binding transcriptional regulator LsrR (DeoR family)
LTPLDKAVLYDFFSDHRGRKRMLIMETIAKVRRLHFVEGKGFKTIARDLRLSKNTVKSILRSGKTKQEY